MTTTIAFSNARRVMMSRGLMSRSSRCESPRRRENIRRASSDLRPASTSCTAATCPGLRSPRPSCWPCTCRRRPRLPGRRGGRPPAVSIVDPAGEIFAVALKGRHDVERLAVEMTGADRAAVDHQRRAIEPAHRDQAAGHVLVAAGERDIRVVPLRLHHGLDRIGDQVARLQRVAHAVGAHRDAVADADGVEPHADQAGRDDPLLDSIGQPFEVHVAGVALVPHAGDADLRLSACRLRSGRWHRAWPARRRATLGCVMWELYLLSGGVMKSVW